jgi:hypothetical protein
MYLARYRALDAVGTQNRSADYWTAWQVAAELVACIVPLISRPLHTLEEKRSLLEGVQHQRLHSA